MQTCSVVYARLYKSLRQAHERREAEEGDDYFERASAHAIHQRLILARDGKTQKDPPLPNPGGYV